MSGDTLPTGYQELSLTPYCSYIGYLATHERFFLGLDTLPLLLGVATYVVFWPGRYLTPGSRVDAQSPIDREANGSTIRSIAGDTAPGPVAIASDKEQ